MRILQPILLGCLLLMLGGFLGSGCSRQATKEKALLRADGYHASGAWDKAEVEYLNALKVDPANSRAIAQLGLMYTEQGRIGSAVAFLRKAKELQPENLDVRTKLAVLYLTLRKTDDARAEARYILERQPSHAEAPLLLAESVLEPKEVADIESYLKKLAPTPNAAVLTALAGLEFRQRKLPECEALLKQALALEPESPTVNASLGTVYQAENNLKAAEAAFALVWKNAPVRSSRKLSYVRFKLQTGDIATARRLLVELTTQIPDVLPPLALLAEIAAKEKNYDEALAINGRILSRDPYHFPAMMLNARLWLAKGQPDKALVELEKIKKVQPDNPEAFYQTGLCLLAQENLEGAATSLRRALEIFPEYVEATLLLTDIQLRKGEAKAAALTIKPLVAKRPELMQAKFLLARTLVSQGELDDALTLFQQVAAASPKDSSLLLPIAMIHRQQKKPAEAKKILNQILELSPDAMPAIEQLVDVDVASGDVASARQRVEALKNRLPGNAGAYLLAAKIDLVEKKYGDAEAELLKVLELQPDTFAAYYLLAGIFTQTNRDAKALEQLEKVAAKSPPNAVLQMRIGMLRDQLKDYEKARQAYEQVLALKPAFVPALNNLAYLYAEKLNALDRSEPLAQKARELAPSDPNIADTLGWILLKKGEFQRARMLLSESASKLSNDSTIHFHLGVAHYVMGDVAPARAALQRALQLSPELPEKPQIKKQLEILASDAPADATRRAMLEKALSENKNDPMVLTLLGGALAASGEHEKAKQTLQAALKNNPYNVNAALALIRVLVAQHETAQALELAKSTRKLAPDDPTVGHQLGRLAFQLGDFQWAASLLQESARKLPDNPEIAFDRAKANYSIGRIADAEEALRALKQAQTLAGSAGELDLYLDMIAAAKQPAAENAPGIEQVLKANPNFVPALMARGALAEKKADLGSARQAYESALNHYPDFSPAKKSLALLAATMDGNDAKIYDSAVQAREAYPNDPELAQALGILTYRKGDFNRAITLLKESVTRLGEDAWRNYYLGMAQYRLKDKAARTNLQRALELGLKSEAAIEAQKALAELK